MSLAPNKTYLVWNGTQFPNSTNAQFKAPAGSTIDWGDGTVETFDTASTAVNTHTYTDGKTEHTIAIIGLTNIDAMAFYNCSSLTSVTIGSSVTSIGWDTFANCSSLTSVTIGNNVTSIGGEAFYKCSSLTSITIPNSVTSIGGHAFFGCSSLTSVTIPNSVTSINDYTFYNCSSLTSVTIPESVTSIGSYVFNGCSELTSVTIPESVTSIGSYAFSNCSKLTQLILFPLMPPTLGSSVINNNAPSIYVQQSSKAAYQAAINWTAFASKIVGDNTYLSFVLFNQKNKEYIDKKLTSALREFDVKLYKHLVSANIAEMPLSVYISIINNIGTTMTSSDIEAYITNRTICLVEGSTGGIGYITKGVEANTYYLTAFSVASGNELSGLFNNAVTLSVWNDMAVTEL